MKIWVDGVVRDATDAELAALEAEQANQPIPDPTPEDRLAALESAMLALMGGAADV